MQSFETEVIRDVLVVNLRPDYLADRECCHDFEEQVLQLIDGHRPAKVLIDFSTVTRLASDSINALVHIRQKLLGNKATLRLCGMAPDIREIFRTMRLDGTLFKIDATRDDSLKVM